MPWPPDVARQDHCLARVDAGRSDRLWRDDPADAGGVDKQPVGLAAIDDFGIAGSRRGGCEEQKKTADQLMLSPMGMM
jgi:hypothetical protein